MITQPDLFLAVTGESIKPREHARTTWTAPSWGKMGVHMSIAVLGSLERSLSAAFDYTGEDPLATDFVNETSRGRSGGARVDVP